MQNDFHLKIKLKTGFDDNEENFDSVHFLYSFIEKRRIFCMDLFIHKQFLYYFFDKIIKFMNVDVGS